MVNWSCCLVLCGILIVSATFNPSYVIPYNMGIAHASASIENIVPDPLELAALVNAGIKWSRGCVRWSQVETSPGVYDLSLFEQFVPLYQKYNISLIVTLFGNAPNSSVSPISDQDIKGFVGYVDAVVNQYQGLGFIWELWNEPDGHVFWQPEPNATQYAALATAVGAYFKVNHPNEVLVGPSISWIGGWHQGGALDFLATTLEHGLLDAVTAVSVHTYRGNRGPETILYPGEQSWYDVRQVINTYSDVIPPLLQTEWGYSLDDAIVKNSTTMQGQFLARSFLSDMRCGISPIIWYDWRDDCADITNGECAMGLIQYRDNSSAPIVPRPTYTAYATLANTLAGFSVTANLTCVDPVGTYALYLTHSENSSVFALAVWNIMPNMHHANFTAVTPNTCFNVVDTFGNPADGVCSDATGRVVVLLNADDVNYLTLKS